MKQHKFKTRFLITSIALFAHSASANPDNYTHSNGSVVVNINKADSNGLSHNMWRDFNVTNKGMVLNNSAEDIVRPSGNISKNTNLDSPAKIILNEVISNKNSTLNGFIEVAGQQADVIIANPSGITCSGCSFINTGHTTLTSGTPVFNNGVLTGFNVAKGSVTVNGNGLKSKGYTDILAQDVRVRGLIETGDLKVVAGVYSYDRAGGVANTNTTAPLSTGIDVSSLGGVTAGVIQLQTTNNGSGVNNSGTLLGDTLQITSAGKLTNSGSMTAGTAGSVNVTSRDKLTNSGNVTGNSVGLAASGSLVNSGTVSGMLVSLSSNDAMTNSGTMEAGQQLIALSVNKITNEQKGKLVAGKNLRLASYYGDIENKGEINSAGALSAQTGYAVVDNETVAVANTRIINSGTLKAAGNASLVATKAITLEAGSLTSEGSTYLSAMSVKNTSAVTSKDLTVYANTVENTGVMQATGRLDVTGLNGISNVGSTLKGSEVTLNTNGKIINQSCAWFVFCNNGTISGDKIIITAPQIAKISDLGGNVIAHTIELNKPASRSEK